MHIDDWLGSKHNSIIQERNPRPQLRLSAGMKPLTSTRALITLVSLCLGTSTLMAFVLQETQHKPRKVKRVKRPIYTEKDWDGIYFNNLFTDGLVGDRPSPTELTRKPAATAQAATSEPAESEAGEWSNWISSDVIEDEVKALEQSLTRDITTPVKFKSEYLKSHASYSMLSMLFGIIREYDSDVRWKKDASVAQVAFARSAAASRVGTEQAYQNAKRRKEDLTELVRGGNFAVDEKAPDDFDWSEVVGRSPVMVRLEKSVELIKPALATKTEFVKAMSEVFHEASLIAAMGQVLVQENMDEAEEDDYTDHAKQMSSAAKQILEACKTQNFDAASSAFNLIGQSCSNCHEDWR